MDLGAILLLILQMGNPKPEEIRESPEGQRAGHVDPHRDPKTRNPAPESVAALRAHGDAFSQLSALVIIAEVGAIRCKFTQGSNSPQNGLRSWKSGWEFRNSGRNMLFPQLSWCAFSTQHSSKDAKRKRIKWPKGHRGAGLMGRQSSCPSDYSVPIRSLPRWFTLMTGSRRYTGSNNVGGLQALGPGRPVS